MASASSALRNIRLPGVRACASTRCEIQDTGCTRMIPLISHSTDTNLIQNYNVMHSDGCETRHDRPAHATCLIHQLCLTRDHKPATFRFSSIAFLAQNTVCISTLTSKFTLCIMICASPADPPRASRRSREWREPANTHECTTQASTGQQHDSNSQERV